MCRDYSGNLITIRFYTKNSHEYLVCSLRAYYFVTYLLMAVTNYAFYELIARCVESTVFLVETSALFLYTGSFKDTLKT
jgi:hypothetical protein